MVTLVDTCIFLRDMCFEAGRSPESGLQVVARLSPALLVEMLSIVAEFRCGRRAFGNREFLGFEFMVKNGRCGLGGKGIRPCGCEWFAGT